MENVPLAPETTLGVGGRARFFCEVTSEAELVAAVDWALSRGLSLQVLGGGSNVVVAEQGYDGLVVKIALKGIEYGSTPGEVEVAAGESWHQFVMSQLERQHQGVECLAGIPGLVGATPIQNVGAYGQEVSESIVEVLTFDTKRACFRRFDQAALKFGYRDSFFKHQGPADFIVTRVRFRFRAGAPPVLRYAELEQKAAAWADSQGRPEPTLTQTAKLVLELRRAKSMLLDPEDENKNSCGSFFVNPRVSRARFEAVCASMATKHVPHYTEPDGSIKLPAAWLIERAGFSKGTRRGCVGLSTKHTLALVCRPGATSSALLQFALEIRRTVERRFNIRLVPEPVFWGFGELDEGLPAPLGVRQA